MSAVRAGDFRPREIAIAVAFALVVEGGAALALAATAIDRPAAVPEVDKGPSVPVKVVPVLDTDSPLLKLGGEKQYKLPDRWVKQKPLPRVEDKAFVSTKASKNAKDIPPPDKRLADAGTPVPPPDAAIAKQVDVPIPEVPDAAPPPPNVPTEGHADGVKEGTEKDPLKARAVDLYRARIAGWFSSRFRVSGSGLPQEELVKVKVRATVELDGRTVSSFSVSPSGNAAFDSAANRTLEGVRGQEIPPPPENYPDVVQRTISVTFMCKEGRCD